MPERYSIDITPTARRHMTNFYDYILEDSGYSNAADDWLDQLTENLLSLEVFPARHPLIAREPFRSEGIHMFPIRNYIAYYTIHNSEQIVRIIAITHSRQDQWRILHETETEEL